MIKKVIFSMKIIYTFTTSLIIAALLSSCAFQNEQADLIVHNALIYTVDEEFSVKEAMAIKDGIIIAIGPEREILNKYTAPKMIDAQKRPIYPGLIDAHLHFLAYGQALREADLVGTQSFSEVLDKVQEYRKNSPQKQWIVGRGWDQNDWTDKSFPDKSKLDSLFPNTPVVLKRIDGHASLVNQAALDIAGVVAGMRLVGGDVQAANGKLTGILIDNAMKLVDDKIPASTEQEDIDALLAAQAVCFENGLTTVDDAGLMKQDVDRIKKLQSEGKLKMRIYAMLSDDTTNFNYYFEHGIDTSARLNVRAFKFYADGALGSRGACLLSPYEDLLPAKNYGFLLSEPNHFRKYAYELRKHGFQMCTHAIGDSANRVILNLYGEVWSDTTMDHRWRIEHAQVVNENDIDKFKKYNIIPSVQPTHATSDMPWAAERLGRSRVFRAYTYKELKNQLGMLALGTDCPVEDISPFATFYAAVTRKNKSGEPANGWQNENAISREDALRGMTVWAAISNFEDHHKGTLEVGKYADFIILDKDLMKVNETEILKTKVATTVLAGEVVYSYK
jgi:predicted amidohydrolase YtcJ